MKLLLLVFLTLHQSHGFGVRKIGSMCNPSLSKIVPNLYNEAVSYHDNHQGCINTCTQVQSQASHVILHMQGGTYLSPYGCVCYNSCISLDWDNNKAQTLYYL